MGTDKDYKGGLQLAEGLEGSGSGLERSGEMTTPKIQEENSETKNPVSQTRSPEADRQHRGSFLRCFA